MSKFAGSPPCAIVPLPVYVYWTPFLHPVSVLFLISTSFNSHLLLKRVPHTPNSPDINTLVEFLRKYISGYIYAYGGAGLETALHAGTVAASRCEARLARGAGGRGDIKAVATGRCCTGGCCACEVPKPGA